MAHTVSVEGSGRRETVSERVVAAVAQETGIDPLSLEPLYSAVDPTALNAVFEPETADFDRAPDRIEFTYSGCDVVVTADGDVQVSEAGGESSSVESWR